MDISQFLNPPTIISSGSFHESALAEITNAFTHTQPGSILEFGVWRGTTINHISKYSNQTIHGFDSFEGLPEDWDRGGWVTPAKKFKMKKLPSVAKNVKLHVGWFDQTVPKWIKNNNTPISFLHMDMDLYSSCAYVLNTLNHLIVPGTIIRFDELADFRLINGEPFDVSPTKTYTSWPDHEWKALNEWLVTYNRKVEPISRTWCQSATIKVIQ